MESSGPVQACNGIALPLPSLYLKVRLIVKKMPQPRQVFALRERILPTLHSVEIRSVKKIRKFRTVAI